MINKAWVVYSDGSSTELEIEENRIIELLADREIWVLRLYRDGKEVFSRTRDLLDSGNILVTDNDNGTIISFYE